MDSMKGRDYIISAEARGEARGEAKGEEKKAIEIAKAMLTKNKPMEEIVEFTSLTVEEIEKLK
jgi:predicted transposase/invertase (TIGR01784 family)